MTQPNQPAKPPPGRISLTRYAIILVVWTLLFVGLGLWGTRSATPRWPGAGFEQLTGQPELLGLIWLAGILGLGCGLGFVSRGRERDREAAQALRESEERYRLLADSTADIIWMVDADLTFTYVSPSVKTVMGSTAQDWIGRNLCELADEESFARVVEMAAEQISLGPEGSAVMFELEMRHSDGHLVPIEVRGRALFDEQGEPMALQGVSRDISQRRQAERKLQEKRRHEESLALCSRDLLEGGEDPITNALGRLLVAADVGRVYVFENFEDPEDGLCMRQTHEAVGRSVQPEIDNPQLQHLSYHAEGFARWAETLAREEHISGLVATFPRGERDVLEPQGILSILILPIMVDGAWYGYIGFDELRRAREWSAEEVRLLRLGAEMLGNFIARKRIEAEREKLIGELRETLEQVKTLRGIIPICAHCKKIRDDKGYWQQVEDYLVSRSEAEFSHSLCHDCLKELYPKMADNILRKLADEKK